MENKIEVTLCGRQTGLTTRIKDDITNQLESGKEVLLVLNKLIEEREYSELRDYPNFAIISKHLLLNKEFQVEFDNIYLDNVLLYIENLITLQRFVRGKIYVTHSGLYKESFHNYLYAIKNELPLEVTRVVSEHVSGYRHFNDKELNETFEIDLVKYVQDNTFDLETYKLLTDVLLLNINETEGFFIDKNLFIRKKRNEI